MAKEGWVPCLEAAGSCYDHIPCHLAAIRYAIIDAWRDESTGHDRGMHRTGVDPDRPCMICEGRQQRDQARLGPVDLARAPTPEPLPVLPQTDAEHAHSYAPGGPGDGP